jgi:TolB protein
MSDPLHSGLSDIADNVAPVDMLERSLRRSKRIGQQRAMAVAGGVMVVAVAAVGVTLRVTDLDGPPPVPANSAASGLPSTAASSPPPSPPSSAPPSSPPATVGSLPGLPGWLYYDPSGTAGTATLGRLAGGRLVPVASAVSPAVSPDGTKIAGIDSGKLIVTDGAGGQKRTVTTGLIDMGYEPVWSPPGDRVLVAKGPDLSSVTLGTVSIASGTFTPLAHNPGGIHYLWSADGKHLGYTKDCRIGLSDADGGNAHLISDLSSCDPFSISPDGTKIAANVLHKGDDAGDIALDMTANTVIDTATGKAIALPVQGTVTQVLFQPDGTTLIRSTRQNVTTLTLLDADGTVRTSVTEPAIAKGWNLAAYR